MKIVLETVVNGHYKTIMAAFDRQLFEYLAPPVAKIELVEFTGSQKGDRVHVKFLSPIKTQWISDITEDGITEDQAWFVDEGDVLPFPLKTWKHTHIVKRKSATESVIIDQIEYTGTNSIFTLLLYPALYFGFYPRKRLYKTYFKDYK